MTDTATRRALLAGLALMPAIAATAAAASVDPTFAAIERHRAAIAALENTNEIAAPAAYAAAEAELGASGDVMAVTVPQTMAGARALLNFTIENAERDGVEGQCLETLKVLRTALDRLAALSA